MPVLTTIRSVLACGGSTESRYSSGWRSKSSSLIAAITLTFQRKSKDEEAKLFGSVTNVDIADALEEKGFEFDRKRISLAEPIKKLGEYAARIRLHPQVTAEVKVVVEPEETPEDDGSK